MLLPNYSLPIEPLVGPIMSVLRLPFSQTQIMMTMQNTKYTTFSQQTVYWKSNKFIEGCGIKSVNNALAKNFPIYSILSVLFVFAYRAHISCQKDKLPFQMFAFSNLDKWWLHAEHIYWYKQWENKLNQRWLWCLF